MSKTLFYGQERKPGNMGYQRRYDNRPKGNPETDEGRDQRNGLIILQKTKDLMQYLYTSWVKYPRSEKPGFFIV